MPDSSTAAARFGSLLSQAARSWRRAADRRLLPFGLTDATWLPLLRVSRAGRPMRQKELAASLGLDGSSIVRVLDALEAGGLLARREDPDDRRAKALTLTPAGQAVVEQVEAVARQVREAALADLPPEAIAGACALLEHICERLDAEGEGA
ncbi:MarR family winged helix-turn-helix transcriptional regulator [Bordetella hinzii]|uniref:MarR family transcriptional regulator n=1 Tax=Bordetella hinzii TaxID=103855 RepID=A0AAN1RY22_9BORD|nr:MarR family transcriptional regulator [Bordetella hinzii]AKQ56943.1 Transcriptional regulator SlyA [Bordetella hinzii]AKQ61409.1 Transcriptional regulator SlyA [Bordetella hinzii]AZW17618.1 MarR family transcriptional regulator [Bordetella hinzii]KCB33392.1 winged helix DNA-binding domain protein [Bordetella hinzii L60]KCB34227.1 winged helix DNA-binding domain protein [Bordetella hinzii CA90 BAL1384]